MELTKEYFDNRFNSMYDPSTFTLPSEIDKLDEEKFLELLEEKKILYGIANFIVLGDLELSEGFKKNLINKMKFLIHLTIKNL
ncbi:MAG: hypothetical protein LBJ09_00565 [Clostridiales bacterium]|jgi:hypothetical protein|nr:hypothetical protein [Clostridiales bacterium]